MTGRPTAESAAACLMSCSLWPAAATILLFVQLLIVALAKGRHAAAQKASLLLAITLARPYLPGGKPREASSKEAFSRP